MCYSGYTTAEWIHSDYKEVENFGSVHYVPKRKMEINYNYEHFIPIENNELYNAYIGDDDYYTSASFEINFGGWIYTNSSKTIKPLLLFSGPSALGKSFLGDKIEGLKVIELELWSNVYAIDYDKFDVIVIGNKEHITTEIVIGAIEDSTKNFDKREFIKVDFSCINKD